MRVFLLPRLKSHGVSTILSRFGEDAPKRKSAIEMLREHADLKTNAASGGVRADKISIDICADLRDIANKVSGSRTSKAKFDQRAAIYLAQRKELKSGEGLRDDVWAFMTTVLAPDVVYWRFPTRSSAQTDRYAGGVRNAFQRLWIRGVTLDRGVNSEARWELVEKLTEDAMVQIFERASLSSAGELAKAIAEGWLRAEARFGRERMEDIMRSATKLIRVRNQIIDLSSLSQGELEQVVDEVFGEAEWAVRNTLAANR